MLRDGSEETSVEAGISGNISVQYGEAPYQKCPTIRYDTIMRNIPTGSQLGLQLRRKYH